MIVYLDILFLSLLLIHCVLLTVSGKIAGQAIYVKRMLCSAFILTVCSVLPLLLAMPPPASWCITLIASGVVVWGCYKTKSLRQWMRALLCFYCTTGAFGGILYTLIFTTGTGARLHAFCINGLLYYELPFWILLALVPGVCFLMWSMRYTVRKAVSYTALYCKVLVKNKNRSVRLTAFLDTGNRLTEPLTDRPVLLAEKKALEPILDDGEPQKTIGYCSVGTDSGNLILLSPDSVYIRYGAKVKNISGIKLAVSETALSGDKSFDALINPNVFL